MSAEEMDTQPLQPQEGEEMDLQSPEKGEEENSLVGKTDPSPPEPQQEEQPLQESPTPLQESPDPLPESPAPQQTSTEDLPPVLSSSPPEKPPPPASKKPSSTTPVAEGPQAKKTSAGGPPAPVAAAPAPEGPQDRKAKEFLDQAEKKVRSAESFLGGLFGRTQKLEDAADLYVRAANTYKVAKRARAAGNAFRQAADIHMKLDTKHEAATHLVEAGQVLKKEDPNEAVNCYHRAIEIYTDMGRFSLAARYHSTVAEIYEGELLNHDQAISNYEQAADFYRGEDSVGSANKCLLKVAHMCALLQQFDKAAGIFEDVGRNSLDNTLLKYGAKDYFFKAAICQFCKSAEDARHSVERYKQIHPGFEGTRELKLINDLLVAHEEEDPDKFAEIVKDYDSISRIDQWLTAQLLHIKKSITAIPDIN